MNSRCLTNIRSFLRIAALKRRLTLLELPPVASKALQGLDSLLSIAQMPGGVPVGTLAIGASGAKNAALLAVSILAVSDDGVRKKLEAFRKKQTEAVLGQRVPK